jgi:hypothetical protein
MTVKIALLKSGEQIISEMMGMFSGEELIKYQLIKPCQVVINGEFRVTNPDEESKENQMSVSLYPWPALTKDTTVEIYKDWVVTLVEPTDDLKEMYETQVLKNGTGTATGIEDNNDDIVGE